MATSHPRTLPTLLLLVMTMGMVLSCKRPETALREGPVQRVELVQSVEGMTPAEEKALVAQLAEGLGVRPGESGPTRVFRLTLKGGPNPGTTRGLGKTVLVSTGSGALMGLLIPSLGLTYWATVRSAVIATGAGGLLGLAYGPVWYQDNQARLKELGYLPWGFRAEWEVLERRPILGEEVVARSGQPGLFGRHTPILDLRPHLKPLPEGGRGEAEIRQASLRAYGEALVKHLRR